MCKQREAPNSCHQLCDHEHIVFDRDRITSKARGMLHNDALVMAGAISRAAHRLARAEEDAQQDAESEPVKVVGTRARR